VRPLALLLGASVALAGCAPQELALSDDPLTRATTCTAVRALELRGGSAEQRPVSFAGFTEILHFAMLSATQDGVAVDVRRLLTVSHRAPTVMQELSEQNWRSLIEPCNSAFPETQRPAPPLATDPYEAGMTCFGIAEFMSQTAADYPAEQRSFAALADRALEAARPVLRTRAAGEQEAAQLSGGYTARSFRAGTPASLLEQCSRRFPPPAPAPPG
jgi:hypothetical protein